MTQPTFRPSTVDHDLQPALTLIESLPGNSHMQQIELARLELKKAREEGEYAMLAQLETAFLEHGRSQQSILTKAAFGTSLEFLRDIIKAHPEHARPRAANPASTPQPAPKRGGKVVLEFVLESLRETLYEQHHAIIQDLEDRAAEGLKKYGTYLETFNGRDPLMDGYQEILDLLMYAKQYELEQLEAGVNWVSAEAPFWKALQLAVSIKSRLEAREVTS